MNTHVQGIVYMYVLISLEYVPGSGTAQSQANFTFNLLRNSQAVFQSGCTILYSQQQHAMVPISTGGFLFFGRGSGDWSQGFILNRWVTRSDLRTAGRLECKEARPAAGQAGWLLRQGLQQKGGNTTIWGYIWRGQELLEKLFFLGIWGTGVPRTF